MCNRKLTPINILMNILFTSLCIQAQFYVHNTMQIFLLLLTSNNLFWSFFYVSEYKYTDGL